MYLKLKCLDDSLIIELKKEIIEPMWERMVNELCPTYIPILQNLDVLKFIDEIDSNTDFIYTTSYRDISMSERYLYISNPAIAVMIQLRGQT
jgi:hypothetical protein